MSTISGVNGSSDAWAAANARRTEHRARLFAKVDTDGNGSVNQAELDTLVSDISQKTGVSLGDNKELFSKMDSNADGNLSSDELSEGMKQFMPPPPTSVDFVQSRGPRGPGGPGGAQAASTTYDPLDTNKDGTVSELERLAGALKELAASDTGDGTASSAQSEIAKLAQKLYDQISANFLDQTSEASLSAKA